MEAPVFSNRANSGQHESAHQAAPWVWLLLIQENDILQNFPDGPLAKI